MLVSKPRAVAPTLSIAFSLSKIIGIKPSFCAFAKIFCTINDLPVIDGPANNVNLFFGIPPVRDPEIIPFSTIDPVSIHPSTFDSAPSFRYDAYGLFLFNSSRVSLMSLSIHLLYMVYG